MIAVNPFQRLPHLYGKHVMEKYKGAAFGELNPHPFAIADVAYRQAFYILCYFKNLVVILCKYLPHNVSHVQADD